MNDFALHSFLFNLNIANILMNICIQNLICDDTADIKTKMISTITTITIIAVIILIFTFIIIILIAIIISENSILVKKFKLKKKKKLN
jgi:hypothetical protein